MEYDNCYPGHYVQWFFFVLGFFLFTIVIVMMVGKLLSKGKTDLITGFTSHKSGKNFEAYLVFNATSGRITYDFPPRK